MAQDILSFIMIVRYAFMAIPTLFIILEDKGGVGKSLLTSIIAALLSFDSKDVVQMVDTDHANSTTAQTHAGTKMLDLNQLKAKGVFLNLVEKISNKDIKHAIVDVGAGQEKEVYAQLPLLVNLMAGVGGRVVAIRPVTTGTHNQRNSSRFMDSAELLKIPTVFVRNEGQGRQPEYFDRWMQTDMRKDAIERGAVETFMADADIRYADEAVGFGLSIADVALRDFSKVADDEKAEAREIFDDDVCAFLNLWLRQGMVNLGEAIQEAVEKRARLDAAKASLEDLRQMKLGAGGKILDTIDDEHAVVPVKEPTPRGKRGR